MGNIRVDNNRFVQRPVSNDRPIGLANNNIQRYAGFQMEIFVRDALCQFVEALIGSLGKKAHVAEIHAEKGHIATASIFSCRKDRSIATEGKNKIGRIWARVFDDLDAKRVELAHHDQCCCLRVRTMLMPDKHDATNH